MSDFVGECHWTESWFTGLLLLLIDNKSVRQTLAALKFLRMLNWKQIWILSSSILFYLWGEAVNLWTKTPSYLIFPQNPISRYMNDIFTFWGRYFPILSKFFPNIIPIFLRYFPVFPNIVKITCQKCCCFFVTLVTKGFKKIISVATETKLAARLAGSLLGTQKFCLESRGNWGNNPGVQVKVRSSDFPAKGKPRKKQILFPKRARLVYW